MDLSAALPTFLITLREGVEAALVVGIVLAYLNKANQRQLNAWVYGGIGAGLAASVAVGFGFNGLLWWLSQSQQVYAPLIKQSLEALLGLVAIGLLSWMLLWMTEQSRGLKTQIEGQLSGALGSTGSTSVGSENDSSEGNGAGWGIFGLIALAVLREGFETVVFIAAQFQQGWWAALGALGGAIGASVIGFGLFKGGLRINIRLFFQIMGVLLLLIVGGLVMGMLSHLDRALTLASALDLGAIGCLTAEAGSCILGPLWWEGSEGLSDRAFPGILLKTLFGYRDHLYAVQLLSYVGFLMTIGYQYFRRLAPNP